MAKSLVLSSLKELSAIVSGGTSGLGLATVKRLSKLGCTVAVIDVKEPKELHPNSYFIKADVTNEQSVLNAIKIIENKAKKLDVLVNCAGVFSPNFIYDVKTKSPHPLNEFERILKINTTGTFNMIRASCSLFNKNVPNENNQRGVIINTSSISATDGMVGSCAYSTSKAAVIGMTLPLARDLAKIGVRVMAIAPGFFATPMIEALSPDVQSYFSSLALFPRRFGHPDEYAHLVQAIIENPMLNGEIIRLDAAIRSSVKISLTH